MKQEPEEREHDEAAEDTSTQTDAGGDPILSGPLLRGSSIRRHSPPPRPKRTQSELPAPISLSPAHPPHHEETHSDDDYGDIPEPALSVRDPLPSFPFDPPPSSAEPQLALTPLGPLPPPTPPPKRDRPADPRSPRPARRQAARTRGSLANAVQRAERSIPPPKEPDEGAEASGVNEATEADVSRSENARDASEGHRNVAPIAWVLFAAVVGIGGFELGLSKGRSEVAAKRIVEVPARTSPPPAPTGPTAEVTSEAPPQEAASPPTAETPVATEAPSASAAPTGSAIVADTPTATATALTPIPSSAWTGSVPTSVAAPPTATAVVTASAAPTSPSGGIDRAALASALARSAGAVAGCPADADGSLTVTVTFLPSGAVGSTSSSGSLAGTQTAACVERLFGVAHIPPFEGDPVTTSTTVSLKAH